MEGLVPDRVPDWLVNQVRKSKGTNMSDFGLLDEYFKETDVVKSDRFDRSHFIQMKGKADELNDLATDGLTSPHGMTWCKTSSWGCTRVTPRPATLRKSDPLTASTTPL